MRSLLQLLDGGFEGFDVVEFHGVLDLDVVVFEDAVHGFAGGDVVLEAHKAQAGERAEFDAS